MDSQPGTLILAVLGPSGPEVFLFDAARLPSSNRIETARANRYELEALLYFETPEELGLPEGELPSAPPGEGGPLPPPFFVYRSVIDEEGVPTNWLESPEAQLSQALRDFRLKGAPPTPCATFAPPLVLPLSAVIGTTIDNALVGADGELTKLSRPTGDWGALRAAFRSPDDGDLWFGTSSGRLLRGDISGSEPTAEIVRDDIPGDQVSWMDGRSQGAEVEIFTLSNDGVFARFDGAGWTELEQLTIDRSSDSHMRSLAPGEALAVSRFATDVVRSSGGRVSRGALDVSGSLGRGPAVIASVAHFAQYIPGFGFCFGQDLLIAGETPGGLDKNDALLFRRTGP